MPDDGISLILEADSLSPSTSEPEEETPEEEEVEEEVGEEVEEEEVEDDEEPAEPAEDGKYARLEAKYNALLDKFQEFSAQPQPEAAKPEALTPVELPELDDEAYDSLLRGDAASFNKYIKQVAESVQTQTLKAAREKIRTEVLGEIDPIVSTRFATERFFDADENADLRPFRTLVGQAINDLIAEKANIKDVNTALTKAGERVRESLALAQKSTKGKEKKKKPALPGSRTSPRKQQKRGAPNRTTQMLEDIAAVMSD